LARRFAQRKVDVGERYVLKRTGEIEEIDVGDWKEVRRNTKIEALA